VYRTLASLVKCTEIVTLKNTNAVMIVPLGCSGLMRRRHQVAAVIAPMTWRQPQVARDAKSRLCRPLRVQSKRQRHGLTMKER
jgi:hypothetical protein